MNLNDISTQCFILALFIRDDGERFLLGTGAYEFKESQLHFAANTMANDVVEVQGNDGYMLAGQVRRPNTQVFDGYIGDASITKAEVEGYRRQFFAFFQKNHFYTVIYIFPNGSAIQRRRGFIVDCGEVKELYQLFPEYHIGMNFEDVNYYKYNEDSDGHEIYGKSAIVGLSTDMVGGLVWEDMVVDTQTKTGVNITFNGSFADEFVGLKMLGDTTQQTYTGKNKFDDTTATDTQYGLTVSGDTNGFTINGTIGTSEGRIFIGEATLPAGTYTVMLEYLSGLGESKGWLYTTKTGWARPTTTEMVVSSSSPRLNTTFTLTEQATIYYGFYAVAGRSYTDFKARMSIVSGSTADFDYEPYVGGTYSPNPDYPQEVNVVSGTQTITVSDGGSNSETYTLALGSIELCKIGTYQDYIYKSGDDWFVHKEIKKRNLTDYKDLAWWVSGTHVVKINWATLGDSDFVKPNNIDTAGFMISNYFTNTTSRNLYDGTVAVGCGIGNDGLYFSNNDWSVNDFKTFITNNTVYIYNVLATATDTQITDSTLVGQLDAVVSGGSYNGNTIISVSGDLASPLEVQAKCGSGGGVEWDSDGAVWEDGGGGLTTVSVDSIENVYPVWKVVGPTNNPTLENTTTGTTISYNGNVANGQTLVVDMLNETAKLNGTSVIGNISGSWMSFAPGNNRVSYTATNSTAPDSTIEWQEIVG